MAKSFSVSSLFMLLLTAATAVGQREAEQLTLETVYLEAPILGAHRVGIRWPRADRNAKLQLDPNTCGIDRFGDVTMSTRMAFRVLDVRVDRVATDDSIAAGRRLYRLVHDGLDDKLFLVEPSADAPNGAWRLVVEGDDDRRRVVTLEVGERSAGAPPKTRTGGDVAAATDGAPRYTARWLDGNRGVVVVTARGANPTGGWHQTLEKGAEDAMPPVLRFIQKKPDAGDVVTQVLTQYEVSYRMSRPGRFDRVIVEDDRGRHEVVISDESSSGSSSAVDERRDDSRKGRDADEPTGQAHRVKGTSESLSFEEALADAMSRVGRGGGPDALYTFKVDTIEGEIGGIAGLRRLVVTLAVEQK